MLEGSTAKTTSTITKLSFREFKKLKEDQRTKKIKANKKAKTIEDVKIQIGVIEELDGHVKSTKGRTLRLVVPSNVSAEALLKAAQDKHSRHFKQFDQHLDYALLYPDQTIVQTLLGSSVPSSDKIMAGKNGKDALRFHDLSRGSSRFPIWRQRGFFCVGRGRGGECLVGVRGSVCFY